MTLRNILPPLKIHQRRTHDGQKQHNHTQRLSKSPIILSTILQSTPLLLIFRYRKLLTQHQYPTQDSQYNLNNECDQRIEEEVPQGLETDVYWGCHDFFRAIRRPTRKPRPCRSIQNTHQRRREPANHEEHGYQETQPLYPLLFLNHTVVVGDGGERHGNSGDHRAEKKCREENDERHADFSDEFVSAEVFAESDQSGEVGAARQGANVKNEYEMCALDCETLLGDL